MCQRKGLLNRIIQNYNLPMLHRAKQQAQQFNRATLVAGAFSHVLINDNGDAFFFCKSASVVFFYIAVYVSIQSNLCFVARHRTHHITDQDHQSNTKNVVNLLCTATWAAKSNTTCRNRDSENEQRFQMAPGFAKTCFAYM